MMYKLEEKFKQVIKGLNIGENTKISTDSLYHGIMKFAFFTNQKTIRKFIMNLETTGYIEKDKEQIGIWIIKKMPVIDPYLEI